ncbi:uncharacterized protein LOC123555976 [Mercenaria mercenaria]|uniref:uncharacterized protein LOC123555976 n=1 Tax=Mercenaria mercenaria TaxID=6596 RepID=UPI00234F59B4|nr:uncharacterized protein LOC123555976 [Mercenaria mercenaria]
MASSSEQDCPLQEILFNRPFDENYPLVSSKFICPVEILTCNGVTPTEFSQARFQLQYNRAGLLCGLYRVEWMSLYMMLANEVEDKADTTDNLKNFFMNKKHETCLKKLPNMKTKANIQAILAVHLFGPLADDGSCLVDKNQFGKGPKTCPGCNEKINLGDTSFGNREVWHGYADIIVENSVVKVEASKNCQDESNEQNDCDPGNRYVKRVESGEPVQKRQKTSSIDIPSNASDCSLSSDKDLDYESSQNIVEVEQAPSGKLPFYQALAQTITNAFLRVNELPGCEVEDLLIPSFLATEKFVRIQMYCCSKDLLLISEDLPLFDPATGDLDISSVIYLSLAMNSHFPAKDLGLMGEKPSKFREYVTKFDKYSCFSDGISQPLTIHGDETQKPVFQYSPLFEFPDFSKYLTAAKKIYSKANRTFYGGQ